MRAEGPAPRTSSSRTRPFSSPTFMRKRRSRPKRSSARSTESGSPARAYCCAWRSAASARGPSRRSAATAVRPSSRRTCGTARARSRQTDATACLRADGREADLDHRALRVAPEEARAEQHEFRLPAVLATDRGEAAVARAGIVAQPRPALDPFAADAPPHVAGGDPHPPVAADALGLSGAAVGVDDELLAVARDPHRSAHLAAVAPEAREVDVGLVAEGVGHRAAA